MKLLQFHKRFGQLDHAIVRDCTGGDRQTSETVSEAAGGSHVSEAGISDVPTKGDVQGCQLVIFGQETDANVTDVITSTEVDGLQMRHLRQGFEASVGDADAETEVDTLEVGHSFGDGPKAVVGQLLTILQAEAFQFGVRAVAEVLQSLVGDLTARPEVEVLEVLELVGQKPEAIVSDPRAACQVNAL